MMIKYLSELSCGESCTVLELQCDGGIRRRFSDLGIIRGVRIDCVGVSPMGDPVAYLVRGKTVAIRRSGARGIVVCVDSSLP